MLGSALIPTAKVFANINEESINIIIDQNENVIFDQNQKDILNQSKESESTKLRVGGKKTALTIAKWILKNRQKLTNTVGSVLEKNTAVKFGNALKYMEGPLRKITNANNQGMKAIYDIIYNGLRASGIQAGTAKI